MPGDDRQVAHGGCLNDIIELTCPYCGEDVELVVDEGGGTEQAYVEDCPVCCRPWQVSIAGDPETGWSATLRTGDE